MAGDLGMSVATVRTHLHRLSRRPGRNAKQSWRAWSWTTDWV